MRINADEAETKSLEGPSRNARDSSIEIIDDSSSSLSPKTAKRKSVGMEGKEGKKVKIAPRRSIAATETEETVEVDQEGNGKVTNYFKTC